MPFGVCLNGTSTIPSGVCPMAAVQNPLACAKMAAIQYPPACALMEAVQGCTPKKGGLPREESYCGRKGSICFPVSSGDVGMQSHKGQGIEPFGHVGKESGIDAACGRGSIVGCTIQHVVIRSLETKCFIVSVRDIDV